MEHNINFYIDKGTEKDFQHFLDIIYECIEDTEYFRKFNVKQYENGLIKVHILTD